MSKLKVQQLNELAMDFTTALEEIDTVGMLKAFLELEFMYLSDIAKEEKSVILKEYVDSMLTQVSAQFALLPEHISYRKMIDNLKSELESLK